MFSAYKLNKQGDNIQPWWTPFPIWNQSAAPCLVLTVASWPAYRFLKRQVRWSGIPISWRLSQSLLWFTQSKALSPTRQQATADPHLCQRLLDTHRQVWVSLFGGRCSFVLGPDVHKVLCVPSKSLFPQSCVCFGGSMVGLKATSSKRTYAMPRATAPRAPAPAAGHCWPVPPQETFKHSSVSVPVGSLGPGEHEVCYYLYHRNCFFFNYENTTKKLEVTHQKIR